MEISHKDLQKFITSSKKLSLRMSSCSKDYFVASILEEVGDDVFENQTIFYSVSTIK